MVFHNRWRSDALKRKDIASGDLKKRALGRAFETAAVRRAAHALASLKRLIASEWSPIRLAADFKAWQLDGDYLEFGVYTGMSFSNAWHLIRGAERTRGKAHQTRFFAFDSFEGLPESKDLDRVYAPYAQGAYAASRHEFERNIAEAGVDLRDVTVVPGFYEKSLVPGLKERIGLQKAAIVYIDCDLYASAVHVLDFLTDLLVDGAIVIFGDWYLFHANPELGQQRAFREWLAKNPSLRASPFVHVPHIYHQSFIIHRVLPAEKQETEQRGGQSKNNGKQRSAEN
jgi:hypothetical protein